MKVYNRKVLEIEGLRTLQVDDCGNIRIIYGSGVYSKHLSVNQVISLCKFLLENVVKEHVDLLMEESIKRNDDREVKELSEVLDSIKTCIVKLGWLLEKT